MYDSFNSVNFPILGFCFIHRQFRFGSIFKINRLFLKLLMPCKSKRPKHFLTLDTSGSTFSCSIICACVRLNTRISNSIQIPRKIPFKISWGQKNYNYNIRQYYFKILDVAQKKKKKEAKKYLQGVTVRRYTLYIYVFSCSLISQGVTTAGWLYTGCNSLCNLPIYAGFGLALAHKLAHKLVSPWGWVCAHWIITNS